MSTLETRDWAAYEQRCREEHVDWLRSLSPAAAFALLEDLHRFASSVETGEAGMRRLEEQRWEDKLARRRQQVEAFLRLDQLTSGQRDPKSSE
jgi:hypothetical protein